MSARELQPAPTSEPIEPSEAVEPLRHQEIVWRESQQGHEKTRLFKASLG